MKLRTFGALIAAVAVLLTFAPLVFAGEQFYGCSEATWMNDTSRFTLYENAIGDSSDGNDALLGCNDIYNLHNVTHAPAGTCNSTRLIFDENHWGDCVSSYYVRVPAGQVFCVFEHFGYYGAIVGYKVGPYSGRTNLSYDYTSSVGFTPGLSQNNCLDMAA